MNSKLYMYNENNKLCVYNGNTQVVYAQCDGVEFEASATVMDLRYDIMISSIIYIYNKIREFVACTKMMDLRCGI